MDPSFRFEDDGAEERPAASWEFKAVGAAVEEEHRARKTTSVDHKIRQLRKQRGKGRGIEPDRGASEGSDHRAEDEEGEEEQDSEDYVLEREREEEGEGEEEEGEGEEDEEDGDDDGGWWSRESKEKGQPGGVEEEKVGESEEHEEDLEEEEEEMEEGDEGEEQGEAAEEALASEGLKGAMNGKKKDRGNERSKKGGMEVEKAAESGKKGETKKHSKQERSANKQQQSQEGRATGRVQEHGADLDDSQSTSFFVGATEAGATFSAASFAELQLSRPLLRACDALGYKKPTPIQAACVPLALAGRDICGSAVTGSGKTAAFSLPVLERLLFRPKRVAATRVLVLTPTRELAVQVHSMMESLAQFTDIRICLVVGGLSIKAQEAALRTRPDVVVASPGRMLDHLRNTQSVGLEDVAILVLDEADRLLEMGFQEEVNEIVTVCPRRRQTLLFSATMTSGVERLISLSLSHPVRLSADPLTQRPRTLSEEVVRVRAGQEGQKEAMLLALCTRKGANGSLTQDGQQHSASFHSRVIIFSGRKQEAHRLKILFGLVGLRAAELHGNLTQAMRLEALETFRTQQTDFLIATDVAARGLDISGVRSVINFEAPQNITAYVHRVGRTARAGKLGSAVTFVEEKDRLLLKLMAKRAGRRLQVRSIASAAVAKWQSKIEEMEEDIQTIFKQEREEMILRKAEMEANKAQNMIEHEAEIYAKPQRTWFQTNKEKKKLAEAAKAAVMEGGALGAQEEGEGKGTSGKAVTKMADAAAKRRKEKLQREREKNLPRKKRRKLEAQREAEEEREFGIGTEDGAEGARKGSTVDAAYRRAKAAKAAARLEAAGKIPRGARGDAQKAKQAARKKKGAKGPSRSQEMKELFKGDEAAKGAGTSAGKSSTKQKRPIGVGKRAFKSKARYKRR